MPWDETDDYIRSGHKDPGKYSTCRTIDISAEQGIRAVYCKISGSDKWEVQSYLFLKAKGWNMGKAKAWFSSHESKEESLAVPVMEPKHPDFVKIYNQFLKRYGKERGERLYYAWVNKMKLDDTKPYGAQKESFKWAEPHLQQMKEDEDFTYWKGEVAFPVASMNRNVYSEAELISASRSLIGKPVNINHDTTIAHEVDIMDAEYEDGALEVLLKVPKVSPINKQIADGLLDNPPENAIIHSSLEATCLRGMEPHPEGRKCMGLVFDGLGLLTKEVLPGIPMTRFYTAESVIGEFERLLTEEVFERAYNEPFRTVKPNKEESETKIEASIVSPESGTQKSEPEPASVKTSPVPQKKPDSGADASPQPGLQPGAGSGSPPNPPGAPATPVGDGKPEVAVAPSVTKSEEPVKAVPSPEPPKPPTAPEPAKAPAPLPVDPNVIPEPSPAILTDDGFWARFDLYHKTHGFSRQDSFRLTALDVLKIAQKDRK